MGKENSRRDFLRNTQTIKAANNKYLEPKDAHVNVHQFVAGILFEIDIYRATYSHYQ